MRVAFGMDKRDFTLEVCFAQFALQILEIVECNAWRLADLDFEFHPALDALEVNEFQGALALARLNQRVAITGTGR
jgi:hypothetical protein